MKQKTYLDFVVEEYNSDPKYQSELIGIAHLAVATFGIWGFTHWSHWWILLILASGLNLIRRTCLAIATNFRNERECDEFIRRHYRL